MSNTPRTRYILTLLITGLLLTTASAGAGSVQHPDFERIWSRLDLPVSSGAADRTWFWGPETISDLIEEEYIDAPNGKRLVVYFDKNRMEINENADPGSTWRVTNGLLATELITGNVQLGDDTFADFDPPEINVAGDPDDPNAPTYATLANLLDAPPLPEGTVITQTINRAGTVSNDQSFAEYGVTAEHHDSATGHTVASVFWKYMTSTGPIHLDGEDLVGPLFENPHYGTGYPITEAYWTRVRVAGVEQPVLVQAFERRVLTYTPHNPDGWKVEAGNVGRHYWSWRINLGDLSAHFDVNTSSSGTSDSNNANEDCEQHSENYSGNGTVKQSNSTTVTNDGNGNSTVTCSQTNITVQGR